MNTETFSEALAQLEARALQIQMEYFKIPPEKRGRMFYAMELVGEMGELINGCKKYIRTRLAHRRDRHARSEIPEEAADTLVALMLVKHAAGYNGSACPSYPPKVPKDDIPWLHTCLSALAKDVADLYAKEIDSIHVPDFDIDDYTAIVEHLLCVAAYFNFSLEQAAHDKLEQIIDKVKAGYYD
jgi:NTP pyrophosphatase (non-canonical NTP hydrolase)